VTRVTRAIALDSDLRLALLLGPVRDDGLADADLELGWRYYGGQIMREDVGPAGTRPWGWWRFVAGEERPRRIWNPETRRSEGIAAEAVRLAELGELRDDELAALRERANEARPRIGTPHERIAGGSLKRSPRAYSVDARAVELLEAVEAAREGVDERPGGSCARR
jgi:hypothetical protein